MVLKISVIAVCIKINLIKSKERIDNSTIKKLIKDIKSKKMILFGCNLNYKYYNK